MLWQKNTSFLEVFEFLSQKQTNQMGNWCHLISAWSGEPVGQTTSRWQNQKLVSLEWGNVQAFVQIYQQLTPV